MTAPARIRQADVARVLKGMEAAGIRVGAVKIDALGNVLIQREGGTPVANENPWDSLLKQ